MDIEESKRIKKQIRREKNKRILKVLFSRKLVVVGSVGLLIFIFLAVFAGVLTPHCPNTNNVHSILEGPSRTHWLGTDQFGRDTLTRLLFGARVSLIIGVLAVAIACVAGVFLGLVSAYFGGVVDHIIMRVTEAFMAIPTIMISLALIAIIGNTITDMALILGIATVPAYTRMIRAMALSVRSSDYVKASQIQGGGSLYIMIRHILPNSMSPVIIMMMQNVGMTILMESGLSFLGIGITIPVASWGSMVNTGRAFLIINPIMALAPGLCVALLVICLNALGDGIRDAMDPRLRGEV